MLQVLVTAPEGIVTQFPKDMKNLGRLLMKPFRRRSGEAKGPP